MEGCSAATSQTGGSRQQAEGRQAGWTSWHNLCVRRVESAKRSYNSIHCNSKGRPNVGWGCSAGAVWWWGWVKWGRHLIAQLLHVLRVPTAHPQAAHTAFTLVWHIHAPNRHKSQLLHTLPRKLRPTNARAGTYSPASQAPPLSSAPCTQTLSIHSVMQNVAYQLTEAKERERGGLEKCVFTKFPSFVCDLWFQAVISFI